MIDFRAKIHRINSLIPLTGIWNALRFELVWSLRLERVKVILNGWQSPLVIRRKTSDMSVFNMTFIDEELKNELPKGPCLIIDGGANVGFTTAYFARYCKEATIAAVEPSNSNLEMLRTNTATFDNVHIFAGALWYTSQLLRIQNPDADAWSFRCVPANRDDPDTFQGITPTEIMDALGYEQCALLKLDIEGGERYLFENYSKWLSRVDRILVEIHGQSAMDAVLSACPESDWKHELQGEKILLLRR